MNVGRIAESLSATLAPEIDEKDPARGNIYRIHYNTVVGGVRSTEQEKGAKFPTYVLPTGYHSAPVLV